MNNVAAEPAFAAQKAQLAERLAGMLAAAGDPRVTGDGLTFERAPFTDLERPAASAPKGAAKNPVQRVP